MATEYEKKYGLRAPSEYERKYGLESALAEEPPRRTVFTPGSPVVARTAQKMQSALEDKDESMLGSFKRAIAGSADMTFAGPAIAAANAPKEVSLGETLSALPVTIGANFQAAKEGVRERVAQGRTQSALKEMLQATFLPVAVREASERGIPLTEHPDIVAAAKDLGIRPDQFARDWPKYANLPESELESIRSKANKLAREQGARQFESGEARALAQQVSGEARPLFKDEWSGRALAFDALASAPDLLATAGAAVAGGPALGAGVFGLTTAPRQIAEAKARGLTGGKADAYALLTSLAEVIPEMPVIEVLAKTPAAKRTMASLLGEVATSRAGTVVGTAAIEGLSESLTEALNIGIEQGLLNETMTIPNALNRIARAGVIGTMMGGTVAGVTEGVGKLAEPKKPKVEPKAKEAPPPSQAAAPEVPGGPPPPPDTRPMPPAPKRTMAPAPQKTMPPKPVVPAKSAEAPSEEIAGLMAVRDGKATPEQVAILESKKLVTRGETNQPRLLPSGRRALVESERPKPSEPDSKTVEATVAGQTVRVNVEPTEAQKAAGNYQKGTVKVAGLTVAIENPKGSIRRGKDEDGTEWEREQAIPYGYVKRTEGADGDAVDVYIGQNYQSKKVFVVNQLKKDGSFDEHKGLIGFNNAEQAKAAYLKNYPKGWKGMGEVVELTTAEFKEWTKKGDTKSPLKAVSREGQAPLSAKKPAVSKAGFFSALTSKIENESRDNLPAAEWAGVIQNAKGVKKNEIDESGIVNWIRAQPGRLTREQVVNELRSREVAVEEVRFEDGNPDTLDPRYYQRALTIRGGRNYREILLTLPKNAGEKFKSKHWTGIDNVLTHLRVNNRTNTNNESVLFIEEIQSDWHQQGRKAGYLARSEEDVANLAALLADPESDIGDVAVPPAPFKQTKDWTLLSMKKAIADAVATGQKRVAWTTGQMQADRYISAIRNVADEIQWSGSPNAGAEINVFKNGSIVTQMTVNKKGRLTSGQLLSQHGPVKLVDVIGFHLSEKVLRNLNGGVITQQDMEVFAHGMESYYDSIIPGAIREYVEKMGAKLEPTTIMVNGEQVSVPSFNITQQMIDRVSGGQPLFAKVVPLKAKSHRQREFEKNFGSLMAEINAIEEESAELNKKSVDPELPELLERQLVGMTEAQRARRMRMWEESVSTQRTPEQVAVLQKLFDNVDELFRIKARINTLAEEYKDVVKSQRDPDKYLSDLADSFSIGNAPLAFKRMGFRGKGMHKDDVEGTVRNIAINWEFAPEIRVFQSFKDIPLMERKLLKEYGFDKNTRGFFWANHFDNAIVLLAENIDSREEAIDTFIHEAVGHYGLRTVFDRDEMNEILDGIWRDMPSVVREYAERSSGGNPSAAYDLSTLQGRRNAAEEVISYSAEKSLSGMELGFRERNFLQRVIDLIRRALDRIGVAKFYDESKIKKIIREINLKLTGQTGRPQVDWIAWSMRQNNPLASRNKSIFFSTVYRDMAGDKVPEKASPQEYLNIWRNRAVGNKVVDPLTGAESYSGASWKKEETRWYSVEEYLKTVTNRDFMANTQSEPDQREAMKALGASESVLSLYDKIEAMSAELSDLGNKLRAISRGEGDSSQQVDLMKKQAQLELDHIALVEDALWKETPKRISKTMILNLIEEEFPQIEVTVPSGGDEDNEVTYDWIGDGTTDTVDGEADESYIEDRLNEDEDDILSDAIGDLERDWPVAHRVDLEEDDFENEESWKAYVESGEDDDSVDIGNLTDDAKEKIVRDNGYFDRSRNQREEQYTQDEIENNTTQRYTANHPDENWTFKAQESYRDGEWYATIRAGTVRKDKSDFKDLDAAKEWAYEVAMDYGLYDKPVEDKEDDGTGEISTKWKTYALEGNSKYNERLFVWENRSNFTQFKKFRHSHWSDDSDFIAHVRYYEMDDADGNPALTIDELQSDWHQGIRDKQKGEETFHASLKSARERMLGIWKDASGSGPYAGPTFIERAKDYLQGLQMSGEDTLAILSSIEESSARINGELMNIYIKRHLLAEYDKNPAEITRLFKGTKYWDRINPNTPDGITVFRSLREAITSMTEPDTVFLAVIEAGSSMSTTELDQSPLFDWFNIIKAVVADDVEFASLSDEQKIRDAKRFAVGPVSIGMIGDSALGPLGAALPHRQTSAVDTFATMTEVMKRRVRRFFETNGFYEIEIVKRRTALEARTAFGRRDLNGQEAMLMEAIRRVMQDPESNPYLGSRLIGNEDARTAQAIMDEFKFKVAWGINDMFAYEIFSPGDPLYAEYENLYEARSALDVGPKTAIQAFAKAGKVMILGPTMFGQELSPTTDLGRSNRDVVERMRIDEIPIKKRPEYNPDGPNEMPDISGIVSTIAQFIHDAESDRPTGNYLDVSSDTALIKGIAMQQDIASAESYTIITNPVFGGDSASLIPPGENTWASVVMKWAILEAKRRGLKKVFILPGQVASARWSATKAFTSVKVHRDFGEISYLTRVNRVAKVGSKRVSNLRKAYDDARTAFIKVKMPDEKARLKARAEKISGVIESVKAKYEEQIAKILKTNHHTDATWDSRLHAEWDGAVSSPQAILGGGGVVAVQWGENALLTTDGRVPRLIGASAAASLSSSGKNETAINVWGPSSFRASIVTRHTGNMEIYNSMYPKQFNEWLKKYKARVTLSNMKFPGDAITARNEGLDLADKSTYTDAVMRIELPVKKGVLSPVMTIEMTPELEAVDEFPLFSRKWYSRAKAQQNAIVNGSQNFDIPSPDKWSRAWNYLVFKAQDKFVDLLKVGRAAAAWKGVTQLPPDLDAYLQQTLFHGRAEEQILQHEKNFTQPLIDLIKSSGYEWKDVEDYLYARHAPEANAYIAKINPKIQSAGSGLSDADAAQVMADLARTGDINKLHAIGKQIDRMTKWSRDLMVSSGLEEQSTIDTWEQTYSYYVPLKGWADAAADPDARSMMGLPAKGSGFDVGAKLNKKRTGRTSKAATIIANVVAQAQATIILSEKAKVNRALYDFLKATPAPRLWSVDEVEYTKFVDPSTGLVREGVNPQYKLADNVIRVKVGGQNYHMTFSDEIPEIARMARAFKNLSAEQVGPLLQVMHGFNRYLSSMSTSFSPEFTITNALRDIQTAMVNVIGTDADGMRLKIVRDWRKAWGGIRDGINNKTSPWADEWQDFKEQGGKVGWIEVYKTSMDLEDKLKRMMGPTGIVQATGDVFGKLKDWVENQNLAIENSVRLSTYVNLKNAGVDKQRAAQISKELTVNFNKKGDAGVLMNSLYLFYNASIQGSARLLKTATSAKGRRVFGGIIALGIMMDLMNRMIGGDDDDDENLYDKVSDLDKEKNIIIMLSKDQWITMPSGDKISYFKIPLPYGINFFYRTGQIAGEYIDHGFLGNRRDVNPAEDTARLFATLLGSYSPLGDPTVSVGQFLSPTIADPFVQLDENVAWHGGPIMPKEFDMRSPTPDSQRFFSSVPAGYRDLANWISEISGGTGVSPGAIEVSPETFQHWADFFGGGVARFAQGVWSTPIKLSTDPTDLQSREVPFMRKLVGSVGDRESTEKLNSRMGEIAYAKREIDAAYEVGLDTPEGQAKIELVATRYPVAAKMIREVYPNWDRGRNEEGDSRFTALQILNERIKPKKPINGENTLAKGRRRALMSELEEANRELRRLQKRDGMPTKERKEKIETQRQYIRDQTTKFNKRWNEIDDATFGGDTGVVTEKLKSIIGMNSRKDAVRELRKQGLASTAELFSSLPGTPDRSAMEFFMLESARNG